MFWMYYGSILILPTNIVTLHQMCCIITAGVVLVVSCHSTLYKSLLNIDIQRKILELVNRRLLFALFFCPVCQLRKKEM